LKASPLSRRSLLVGFAFLLLATGASAPARADGLDAQVDSQSYGALGAVHDETSDVVLEPGDETTLRVMFLNSGTTPWPVGGSSFGLPRVEPVVTSPAECQLTHSELGSFASWQQEIAPSDYGYVTVDVTLPSTPLPSDCHLDVRLAGGPAGDAFGDVARFDFEVIAPEAPTLSLSPIVGRQRNFAYLPIQGTATDNAGVAAFEYRFDGTGPWQRTDYLGAAYNALFDVFPGNLAPGAHTLEARSLDYGGRASPVATIGFLLNAPPVAAISITKTKLAGGGHHISLRALATDDTGSDGITFQWNVLEDNAHYEDGQISTGPVVDLDSADGHFFTVNLTATDADGDSSNAYTTVYSSNQLPLPLLTTPAYTLVGNQTRLGSHAFDDGSPTELKPDWSIDGRERPDLSGWSPAVRLPVGIHSAKLTVTDGEGATSATTATFYVITPPVLLITTSHDLGSQRRVIRAHASFYVGGPPFSDFGSYSWWVNGVARPDLGSGSRAKIPTTRDGLYDIRVVFNSALLGGQYTGHGIARFAGGPERPNQYGYLTKLKPFAGAYLSPRSARAALSLRGFVYPRIQCPAGTLESLNRPNDFGFCRGRVSLMMGRRAIAHSPFTIRSGDGPSVETRLPAWAVRRVTRRGSMRVTAVVVSYDGRAERRELRAPMLMVGHRTAENPA
jgi:hypothetical protein